MGDSWEAELSRVGGGRGGSSSGRGGGNLPESPAAWRLSGAAAALGAETFPGGAGSGVGRARGGGWRPWLPEGPCLYPRPNPPFSGCRRRRRAPGQFSQPPLNCLLSVPPQFLDLISSSGRRDPKSVQQPILLKEG